jgi:CIC family chloride channel protein
VVEADGRLAGMITLNEMAEAAFDRSHDAEWTARDVTRPEPAMLAMDDDLMTAMTLFSASGEAHLPVVRDRETMTLVGMAHEHRVLASYHQAVIRARAEERGED